MARLKILTTSGEPPLYIIMWMIPERWMESRCTRKSTMNGMWCLPTDTSICSRTRLTMLVSPSRMIRWRIRTSLRGESLRMCARSIAPTSRWCSRRCWLPMPTEASPPPSPFPAMTTLPRNITSRRSYRPLTRTMAAASS